MSEADEGFKEGQPVWVEDGDGKRHPGVFVGYNETSAWFGGGPSAYVAHPETKQAEVVPVFRDHAARGVSAQRSFNRWAAATSHPLTAAS